MNFMQVTASLAPALVRAAPLRLGACALATLRLKRELTGLVQYITLRRHCGLPRLEPIPHPWQAEPPLPVNVTLTFHTTILGAFQRHLAGR
jgi:hypothetical protein